MTLILRQLALWTTFAFLFFFSIKTLASQFEATQDQYQHLHNIAQQRIAARNQTSHTSATNSSLSVSINKHGNRTQQSISDARGIVAAAISEAATLNKARIQNPRHNQYTTKPTNSRKSRRQDDVPTLTITPEISAAAAIIAEVEAATAVKNDTQQTVNYSAITSFRNRGKVHKRATGKFWMENIDHLGTQPFGGNSSYKVFRNVKDYGAVGDGITDDTIAINKAISDGNRCGGGTGGSTNCYSSSVKGALVYFPTGTYLVSTSILLYYNTQMVGNANDIPTIKGASSFVGLGVISTDVYVGGTGPDGLDAEWYINTSNFYRQIRNFNIDITATDQNAYIAAVHYQVSQATSITNVAFICSDSATTTQQAIYAENGSGGYMSDLIFLGGAFGIYGGNQQFTAMNLSFLNVRTAIQIIWDWGFTWQLIQIASSTVGISLLGEDGTSKKTGSLLLQDAAFFDTETAILTTPPSSDPGTGTTGILLDNVAFSGVMSAVKDSNNQVWLSGSVENIDTWTMGRTYFTPTNGSYTFGKSFETPRIVELTTPNTLSINLLKDLYLTLPKPQYESYDASQIIQMKWFAQGKNLSKPLTA